LKVDLYEEKMSTSAIANELPAEILGEIEYWSKKEKTDTTTFILRLIDEGLHEWKLHKALGMYKNQEISIWKAAEVAGVSLAELLSELPKQKIIFQYDLEDLKEDIEYANSK
jgi:predicted HTH domain antitoxin